MSREMPLVDTFGRVHSSLRISVTDRCNIRCFYCMPEENVRFLPRAEILSFEEIHHLVVVFAQLGVNKLRITGGEPLVRSELDRLVRMLVRVDGIEEVALTTNGILLKEQASALKRAGLSRVNISLDSLNEQTYRKITRRDGLDRVLNGIEAAKRVGIPKIRLNSVAIAGLSEREIVPLAEFARKNSLELRFIEYMPLDADQQWAREQVLSGESVRTRLQGEFGPLLPVGRSDASQPAVDYQYADNGIRVGFINSVTEPFCSDCNRLRLTAEGKIRNCLFATTEWDLRQLIRSDKSDDEIRQIIIDCVRAKKAGHGINSPEFIRPHRSMHQIGG